MQQARPPLPPALSSPFGLDESQEGMSPYGKSPPPFGMSPDHEPSAMSRRRPDSHPRESRWEDSPWRRCEGSPRKAHSATGSSRPVASSALSIVRDAKDFLNSPTHSSPTYRRRGPSLDPTKMPFADPEPSPPGKPRKLPSLGMENGGSAPPTRGSPAGDPSTPLRIQSPPKTDPSGRRRRSRGSGSPGADLPPAMPNIPSIPSMPSGGILTDSPLRNKATTCKSQSGEMQVEDQELKVDLERSSSGYSETQVHAATSSKSHFVESHKGDQQLHCKPLDAVMDGDPYGPSFQALEGTDGSHDEESKKRTESKESAANASPDIQRLQQTVMEAMLPQANDQKEANPKADSLFAEAPPEPDPVLRARTDCDYWDDAEDFGESMQEDIPCFPRALEPALSGVAGEDEHHSTINSATGLEVVKGANGVLSLSFSSSASNPEVPTSGREPTANVRPQFKETPTAAVLGSRFNWTRGEFLGRGSLGCVFKALDQETGRIMAVKEVILDPKDEEDNKFGAALENEIALCRDLHHQHIVSYHGHDHIGNKLYIYLEYMPGGSISQVLSQFGPLDEGLVAVYTRDLLSGLEYLHTRDPPVLHRDIKGANILVGIDCRVKLSDFGCSKRTTGTWQHTMKGSVPWMAPEMMTQTGYDRKADIWSLGCVLIEMSTGRHPWGSFDNNLAAMVRIAMSQDTPPVPDHLSEKCQSFIKQCTKREPKERPDCTQLLEYPFVNELASPSGETTRPSLL